MNESRPGPDDDRPEEIPEDTDTSTGVGSTADPGSGSPGDGPPELTDAARQETEYPADETDEG
jgi:hypothetical protein